MLFTALVSTALLAMARAAPTALSSGFPSPTAEQLAAIGRQAGGMLSNAPLPATLNASSAAVFQLINFNENFEVAFFKSLIHNITHDVPGFARPPVEKTALLTALQTIVAQEELHALLASTVLAHAGAFAPGVCEYTFPSTDLASAVALASTFTSAVLGTLQDAAEGLAINGDAAPVRALASVIGEEGEQNGWFRTLLDRVPAQKPFLTTSTGAFLFSSLQDFVVSCPFALSEMAIPVLPRLHVASARYGGHAAELEGKNQTLTLAADLAAVTGTTANAAAPFVGRNDPAGLFVTYLTGQNVPASVAVDSVTWNGTVGTFAAFFPYEAFVMDGLTVAALTAGSGFAAPGDVVAATLAGPALINVNSLLVDV